MYHPFNISKPDFILDDTDKYHRGRKIAIWKEKNFRVNRINEITIILENKNNWSR